MALIKVSVYHKNLANIADWWDKFLDHCWGPDVTFYDAEYDQVVKAREKILAENLSKYRAKYKNGYIEFADHSGYMEFLLTWS